MMSMRTLSDQIPSTNIPDLSFSSSKKITYRSNQSDYFSKRKAHLSQLPVKNIILEGSKKQKEKLTRWLNDIAVIPKGYTTLKAIEASGHTLTITHSVAARLSSGRTIAPMTEKIINGAGDSVKIIFDADMEDRGTHRVFGLHNELIEFNAIQNLYHELAHAMHQMQGTWRYFASEKQAIEEENEFRKDLANINGEPVRLRYRSKGVMITKLSAGGLGYSLPH